MKKILIFVLVSMFYPIMIVSAEQNAAVVSSNTAGWQKTLQNSIVAAEKIQNSVERNKLLNLLNKLQANTKDILNPPTDNVFLTQHYQAEWQAIDAKLIKRLASAKQNLPDNNDKKLILNILLALSAEVNKIVPSSDLSNDQITTTTELTPAELGRNLYYQELLNAKLPEVRKILTGFSPSIFISYAWGKPEQAFVPSFAEYLEEAGLNVRLDINHNRLSTEIHTGFVTELEQVDYIIVVGSKLYGDKARQGKNNVVSTEARIIAERNKRQPGRVLPLLLSSDPKEAFPPFLRDKVFVNFTDPKQYVQELGKVILTLSKYAPNKAEVQKVVQAMDEQALQIQNMPTQKLEDRYYQQQKLR